MTEHIASFIYDPSVPYGTYNVYACYDSMEDYDNRKVAFYDLYDNSGLCVNEGDPLYECPSWQDVYDWYYLPSITESEKDHTRDLKFLENN